MKKKKKKKKKNKKNKSCFQFANSKLSIKANNPRFNCRKNLQATRQTPISKFETEKI